MALVTNTHIHSDGNSFIAHIWVIDSTKPTMYKEGNFYKFNTTYIGCTKVDKIGGVLEVDDMRDDQEARDLMANPKHSIGYCPYCKINTTDKQMDRQYRAGFMDGLKAAINKDEHLKNQLKNVHINKE